MNVDTFIRHTEALKYIITFTGNNNCKLENFFRNAEANFCKIKKCKIFNIEECLRSKKSKFDMILIRHSPFTIC